MSAGALTITLPGEVNLDLVLIPAGSFLMGSPDDEPEREQDEGPLHLVTIRQPFYLGKYQVTQKQWAAVPGHNWNPSYFRGEDLLPVDQVSWSDCLEYIENVNRLGLGVFRLRSESEWEYACRAGTSTPFSTGDTLTTQQANFDGSYPYNDSPAGEFRSKTMPVGSFPPNSWGLHEMHGNLWEWCQDWYHADYVGAMEDGAAWEQPAGEDRVRRGGSWGEGAAQCRAASRIGSWPDARNYCVGLRLVRNIDR